MELFAKVFVLRIIKVQEDEEDQNETSTEQVEIKSKMQKWENFMSVW